MHNLRTLVVALLLTSLAIAPAFAKRNGCENFSEKGGQREGKIEHLKEKLDLTEQQEADINEILAARKAGMAALREETRTTREAIREMSRAETLDESRLRELVRKQSDQRADMMIARHATRARINTVLTPEQQEKHKAFREQRQERRGSVRGSEENQ
jgi:Spy/CpxP family protein refolding chaperone